MLFLIVELKVRVSGDFCSKKKFSKLQNFC